MPTYKDEKTGLWYCKFVYTDWTGARRQKKKKGFRLQKEAKEYELDFLSKSQVSCDMKFRLFAELYLEDCRARLKVTTYPGKANMFEKHILPYFGELKLNEITAATVRQWQTKMLSSGKYKPTYLKSIHNQLSAAFNYACRFYGLRENPARSCGSMGKKKADKMDFWTLDEFRAFNEAIGNKIMTKTIFNLLYWSGMRSGELLALSLRDFDFEARTVAIDKNYARLDSEDLILEPKTPKSNRTIGIPSAVCDMVRDYASRLVDYEDGDRLFEVTKGFLYHEMKRISEKSGVKKIRIHDIRHSHASLLIELGTNILLVSERLGHEDVQTTLDIYGHLYPHKDEEVAGRLDRLCA